MTLLIALAARLGVPERFQRLAAWIALAVATLALLALLKSCYDDALIDRHDAEREAAASGARETAADERASDAVTNTRNEEELHDAIDAAPTGGTLSPAARALACQRLRKLGRIPPACRPEGGNGGQAAP